jgi:hypothetical protein
MQKVLSIFIISLLIFQTVQVAAQPQPKGNLVISPAIQEVEAKSGNSYDLEFAIENNSESTPIIADVNIESFVEGDIPGSTNLVPFNTDNDISNWIKIPKIEEFPPKQLTKKPFKLSIPVGTKPGAYFFAIVFQPRVDTTPEDKSNLVIETRLANLLFVNIAGDTTKQPVINNFSTNLNLIDTFFDKLTTKFEVEVKGNSYYRTSGNMFLTSDPDNITILQSNFGDTLMLPGGKKTFNDCFENHIFSFFLIDSCSTTNTSKLPYFGKKKIELKLEFTNVNLLPQSTKVSKELYFFPYKTLFLVISLVILILVILKRSRNKQLKNKSKK